MAESPTPGPWMCGQYGLGEWFVGRIISDTPTPAPRQTIAKVCTCREADARLMAASPELRDALARLVNAVLAEWAVRGWANHPASVSMDDINFAQDALEKAGAS